jgi:hypothetical protein
MEKGWREGKGNVIGGGEVDDMVKQGSRLFACGNVAWVVVGVDAPPSLVEGGREWPHLADWAPEVGCNNQDNDEAFYVDMPSDGV